LRHDESNSFDEAMSERQAARIEGALIE
jgi:hypothetical protein